MIAVVNRAIVLARARFRMRTATTFQEPDPMFPRVPLTAVLLVASASGAFAAVAPKVTEGVLYSFKGGPSDGAYPQGSLATDGTNFYGTTFLGGPNSCSPYAGCGAVFSVTQGGTEMVLHLFSGGAEGANPEGALVVSGGMVYGTTLNGGALKYGTAFSVTPEAVFNRLHSFGKGTNDGLNPAGGVILVGKTLYGTTEIGGADDGGAIFKMTTQGKESVVYSLNYPGDGGEVMTPLVYAGGTFYGTTETGGTGGDGVVFSMTPSGTYKVLHSFLGGSDGRNPVGALLNVGGTLYGATESGGNVACQYGCGTIYTIAPSGTYAQLYQFNSSGSADGANPGGGLTNRKGTLYGVTENGGTGLNGTVFSITKAGAESVVYNFASSEDAALPTGTLLDMGGTLYGESLWGGANNQGTVFWVKP
jgi:uncharacterized repeat protein (TIGR03803 family)